MSIKAYGLALALVFVPAAAFAQTAAPQAAAPSAAPDPAPNAALQTAAPEVRERMRAACGADVQKFCANVERAKGAMRGCLEAHATQLSDGCKAARAERAAARAKEKG